jgi:phage-related protein
MASIYDTVPTWLIGSTYNKYDIVKGTDTRYYYSVIDSNLAQNPITTTNLQVEWDGYIVLNGILVPNFFWKPSYNSKINNRPRVKINQFGNGYQQRSADGLNFDLIEFSLSFQNRKEKETLSILHFLNERRGKDSFIYNLPSIYSKNSTTLNSRFICLDWSVIYISFDNYSIEALFNQVVI